MARLYDISFTGDKALQKTLDRLVDGLQNKFMRPAMRAAAKPIEAAWVATVPEDTGRYRHGIKVKLRTRRKRVRIFIVSPPRIALGIPKEAKWYYPAVIEFGGVTESGRVIPAGGYGRRALETQRATAIAAFADTLWSKMRGVR